MIKWHTKWLSPLVLAVFLHLGIALILYVNFDARRLSNPVYSTEPTTSKQSTTNTADNEDSHVDSKDYMTTLSIVEPISTSDSYSKPPSVAFKQTIDRQASSFEDTLDDDNREIKKVEKPSNQGAEEKSQSIENNVSKENLSATSNNTRHLEKVNKDTGLLSIDIPKNTNQDELIEENLLLKSETEEINRQLSSAINEIKKRNQQKINKIQQEQIYYIHNIENNKTLPESSSE